MSNIDQLTVAGIIPKGYDGLSDSEKSAIESMTQDEVSAIISASAKVYDVMKDHQPHGMAY